MFVTSLKLMQHGCDRCSSSDVVTPHMVDEIFRNSLLVQLFHPLLCGLCLCCQNYIVAQGVLPYMVYVSMESRRIVSKLPDCYMAQHLIASSFQQNDLAQVIDGGLGGLNGDRNSHNSRSPYWKSIPNAVFEDLDSSYSLNEDGSVYLANQSSNTCALVNVRLPDTQKSAWEFLLEMDNSGIFG